MAAPHPDQFLLAAPPSAQRHSWHLFEAFFTIKWRPTWRSRLNAEELLRTDIHAAAQRTAARLESTDLPAAQDTVNAALARVPSADAYRLVAVHASLRLSPESKEALTQQQENDRRIRHLQFLKNTFTPIPT